MAGGRETEKFLVVVALVVLVVLVCSCGDEGVQRPAAGGRVVRLWMVGVSVVFEGVKEGVGQSAAR